mgnify:CR=1 FL=1
MIKMSRKAKKAMAVALTAGMLASTAVTPVMAATQGWKQNSKGWWYQNADGSITVPEVLRPFMGGQEIIK